MSCTRFGIGYLGSKNDIADKIVDILPPADVFIDAFAGGCAVTHAAMLSGKYRQVIANDINDVPQLFLDVKDDKCVNAKHWVSREEFFCLKDSDVLIRLVWSFGYDGKSYCYGRDREPFYKAVHYAVMERDYSLWEAMGLIIPDDVKAAADSEDDWNARRLIFRKWFRRHFKEANAMMGTNFTCRALCSPSHLERIHRLGKVASDLHALHSLNIRKGDFATLPSHSKTCITYCDPPYKNTDCGSYSGFDHERFYDWVRADPYNKYISEYTMPDDFVCIAEMKQLIKRRDKGSTRGTERLFVHRDFDKVRIKSELF